VGLTVQELGTVAGTGPAFQSKPSLLIRVLTLFFHVVTSPEIADLARGVSDSKIC